MRIIGGIEVPETMGEVRKMNYEQLQKACEVFNNNSISSEDIQKAWNNNWWEGFKTAMSLIYEAINACDFTLAYTAADMLGLIEDNENEFIKHWKKK